MNHVSTGSTNVTAGEIVRENADQDWGHQIDIREGQTWQRLVEILEKLKAIRSDHSTVGGRPCANLLIYPTNLPWIIDN